MSKEIPEDVGERGFEFEERFEGDFVYLSKTIAVDVGEVLNLEFFDQKLVRFGEVHLPDGSSCVNVEGFKHMFRL